MCNSMKLILGDGSTGVHPGVINGHIGVFFTTLGSGIVGAPTLGSGVINLDSNDEKLRIIFGSAESLNVLIDVLTGMKRLFDGVDIKDL